MTERFEGEVKWFNDARGYGFINLLLPDGVVDETTEYFVHFSSIKVEGFKTLQPKQLVTFELVDTPKGRQAVEVEILK